MISLDYAVIMVDIVVNEIAAQDKILIGFKDYEVCVEIGIEVVSGMVLKIAEVDTAGFKEI